jgi:hypothetical protein
MGVFALNVVIDGVACHLVFIACSRLALGALFEKQTSHMKPCADWIVQDEKGILDGVKHEMDINLVDDDNMLSKVKLLGQQNKRGKRPKLITIRKTQQRSWKRKLRTSKKNKLSVWVKTKEHWR